MTAVAELAAPAAMGSVPRLLGLPVRKGRFNPEPGPRLVEVWGKNDKCRTMPLTPGLADLSVSQAGCDQPAWDGHHAQNCSTPPQKSTIAARSEDAAERRQREIAERVVIPDGSAPALDTVVGLDVSYFAGSRRVAAAVAVDRFTGVVLSAAVVEGEIDVPYRPGLLAFREAPMLLDALDALDRPVDLLLCDGQGVAHPRRCGLACHLGVETGLAAVGCVKSWLVGDYDGPGPRRGDQAPLRDDGELVGYVVRTQDRVRPVWVSPGHGIGFDRACDIVLATTSRYRLPDPIRRADHLSRQALRRPPSRRG